MTAQGSREYFSRAGSLVVQAAAYNLLTRKEQATQIEMFNRATHQAFFVQLDGNVLLINTKLGDHQRLHFSRDSP